MIPNRQHAISTITGIIRTRVSGINSIYGGGPSLHFYHRILELRRQYPAVGRFLASDICMEILYAALVSWNMNSRGARMKDFDDFKSNLRANAARFNAVESAAPNFSRTNRRPVMDALSDLYDHLALMKTKGKLVANSKALHFMFPEICLPMDGTNTLKKLYGHAVESKMKYLEVLDFACDIIDGIPNPQEYLDDRWNTSATKLVDNAIILMLAHISPRPSNQRNSI